MTAADEYQRVLWTHQFKPSGIEPAGCYALGCEDWRGSMDEHRGHVAQALAADPGVRAAVELEVLERAVQAIEADPMIARCLAIVRDPMPQDAP